MLRRTIAIGIAVLGLSACGAPAPQGAAETASRLLAAAYKGDRVAFEAEIDRAAVREDVRRQVTRLAKDATLDVDGGPSEFALDRMISPAAFRLVHAGSGEALRAPPTPAQVAKLMRTVDARHACLRDAETPNDGRGADCLLTFAKGKDQWRLVGMKAMGLKIELADSRP
ncbi:MAG TPA: hypothetical protein VF495_16265 [Phenylobacterium sp.]|jgi:hypothetical protein